MEIHLVADTNLFFECKVLEDLPWHNLGGDPVVVLLTKPVLDEIDKHKKSTGRTRDRALDIFNRVRAMLALSVQEVEIRAAAPKVVLRRLTVVAPDPALKDSLDYSKTDERLIGIVSTLNAQASGYSVKLFTDDTGPAAAADDLRVPYLMIDKSWRRPVSETTEAKKIKELEKDLSTYRAQEPQIVIGACAPADSFNVVEVVRKIATPLTEAEVDDILTALLDKHPLVSDFTPPPPSMTTTASGEVTRVEYTAPMDDDIANYRDVLYPGWLERCRTILSSLHEGRDEMEPTVVLSWPMSNTGTRPASQVRVEFEATGPLALRRLHEETEDEEGAENESATSGSPMSSMPTFPLPPKAPSFSQQVTRTPTPPLPNVTRGRDIATFIDADSATTRHMKFLEAVTRTAALGRLPSALLDPLGPSFSQWAALRQHPIASLPIPPLHTPRSREPEAFYYDWPRDKDVQKGALTCELWRHQRGEETFEFEVVFTREGAARGTVVCTVHAENLTKPEQASVIVGRKIETLSMTDLAKAMVEACQ